MNQPAPINLGRYYIAHWYDDIASRWKGVDESDIHDIDFAEAVVASLMTCHQALRDECADALIDNRADIVDAFVRSSLAELWCLCEASFRKEVTDYVARNLEFIRQEYRTYQSELEEWS